MTTRKHDAEREARAAAVIGAEGHGRKDAAASPAQPLMGQGQGKEGVTGQGGRKESGVSAQCPTEVAGPKAEHLLAAEGVFKGHEGLRGLAECDEFWAKQEYGTRLYFGPGVAAYLHRSVLRAAINALDRAAKRGVTK